MVTSTGHRSLEPFKLSLINRSYDKISKTHMARVTIFLNAYGALPQDASLPC